MTKDKIETGPNRRRSLSETELLSQLAQLPREMTPDNDGWGEVSAGIDQVRASSSTDGFTDSRKGRHSKLQGLALVATVVIAFAVGILTGQQLNESPLTPDTQSAGRVLHPDPIYFETLAATERVYQAAFREFVSVGPSPLNMPPKTMEQIEQGWQVMRETETALTSALNNFPANPFLIDKMMDLRKRQLAFLQQVADIDQNNRSNTRRNII
jgi:hypothetical protein